ncbi:hypothetical protein [Marinitoga aeolica]|uniref:Uncharacterized protein n=1 Tax=Marinitoga aeolica TaxID=2809031 RepID=A0ABY8PNR3_9BACT|nr:hypothetical protein [Marinitoga aeolica]WGS64255.1 hypothetical protein JRV97_07685 [Marinitoga aeolica]
MPFLFLFSIFIVSILISWIIAKVFNSPIKKILEKIINDPISDAWRKYLIFAIYITGISSGVRIWEIERYFGVSEVAREGGEIIQKAISLTPERWTLEILRTIIEALQGISVMLLIFFIFALIAFVIMKAIESKHSEKKNV